MDNINRALEYIISKRASYEKAVELQNAIWRREKIDMPPLALMCGLTEEQKQWLPYYNTKEIHFSGEKMFVHGLREVLAVANADYGAVPSMRANMGCGIIPSLFGNQQRLFDDKMPWMLDHVSREQLIGRHSFDSADSKEFTAALEHIDYMTGKLRGTGVFVYPLDLQGAVDTAHIVYGDAFFYDLYDEPEFVRHLLDLSCESIYYAMDKCFEHIDNSGKYVAHYNHLIIPRELGGVKLSEDTTTLLSPKLIDEFGTPYIRNILSRFGGGYVHYCGKNDYLLDVLFNEPLVRGINFGNPEKHDMSEVIKRCALSGKIYTGSLPKNSGENDYDYFLRLLKPAYRDGRFHIILQYHCSLNDRGSVIDSFERAVETVIKPDA